MHKICLVCGESYITETKNSLYCSPRCLQKAYRQRRRQEQAQAQKLPTLPVTFDNPPMGLLESFATKNIIITITNPSHEFLTQYKLLMVEITPTTYTYIT